MAPNDFAAAQRRIATRQQLREAEALRIDAEQSNSRVAAQVTQLPSPVRGLSRAGVATWDRISGRGGTRPAFRVGQVDAELLDEELLELLKAQVGEALKYFGTHVQDDWSAEIMLALRAIVFKLSVWDHDATYGAALQNLKFTDATKNGLGLVSPSKWQKTLYGVFTVGGKYAWTRWENWLVDNDNGYDEPSPAVQMLSRFSDAITTIHSTAAFASFLIFLVNGRYRTLLDRALKLRLAPPTSQVSREVSFEYLNRQLVWHAFTEFLLFVLPLVGISRWRRWLLRAWRKTKSLASSGSENEVQVKTGEYAFLPERTCAICYQDRNPKNATEADVIASSGAIGSSLTDVTNPYETIPCGCIYCYMCIVGRVEAEDGEGWTCLRCGDEVKECKPWSGDVIEAVVKPVARVSGVKSVGFSPDPIRTIDPRPEGDGTVAGYVDGQTKGNMSDEDSSSNGSEGEEAFDEEQEGELDEDDAE